MKNQGFGLKRQHVKFSCKRIARDRQFLTTRKLKK